MLVSIGDANKNRLGTKTQVEMLKFSFNDETMSKVDPDDLFIIHLMTSASLTVTSCSFCSPSIHLSKNASNQATRRHAAVGFMQTLIQQIWRMPAGSQL